MGSNLRRRDATYWFRRRVPDALRNRVGLVEINRTLDTTCARTARERARQAWLRTEHIFSLMTRTTPLLSHDLTELLIERLRTEPLWNSPRVQELASTWSDNREWIDALFGGLDRLLDLPTEDRKRVMHHVRSILDAGQRQVDHEDIDIHKDRARAAELRQVLTEIALYDAKASEAAADGRADQAAADAARAEVDLLVERRVAERLGATSAVALAVPVGTVKAVTTAEPMPAALEPTEPEGTRPLSEFVERFFEAKLYPLHTEKQNRTTIRLWMEIVGDKRTDSYTEDDAFLFQRMLREMPSSHGKGGEVHAMTLIGEARGTDKPRLKEKTIERHFSCMRQFWLHLGKRRVDKDVFDAIECKVEDNARSPWSESALDKLLRAHWNPYDRPAAARISEEEHAWIVAIGGYTGARVEEIARLRTIDVDEIDDVPCIVIRKQFKELANGRQEREWMTKTPDGERAIPVHPRLLDAGFLDLVTRRRVEGAKRLFALTASAPANKLAADYSREFSRLKTHLGIPEDVTFHSFRHNVETILGGKEVKQVWVDTMLGHKHERPGDAKKSVGLKVYFHGLEVDVMQKVAFAVEYPDHICPTLLLKRVRGEVSW